MISGREKMKIEAEMTRQQTIAVSKAEKLIHWYAVDAANQQTDSLKAWKEVERLQAENAELRAELAKFHPCEETPHLHFDRVRNSPDKVCFYDDTKSHRVYHKEEE